MKKNLLSAVLLLLVAVFSFGVASFAFFSGYDEGGNNTVSPGSFDFTLILKNSSGGATVSGDIDFKFPTKINFPKIDSGSSEFATDGDDTYFNSAVAPIFVTLNNNSSIPVNAEFSFSSAFASGTDDSSCIEWFIFDPAHFASIKLGAKYDEKLHELCDALSSEEIDAQTTIYSKSLKRLEEGRRIQKQNIKAISVSSGDSIEVMIVAWLDYEKFNAIYNNVFSAGKVKLMITADVIQAS